MIEITPEQKEKILEHARAAYPNEACGILAGKEGRVSTVYAMKNASDAPALCYFMDPAEQLKVMKEIREGGKEMIAIYHSHASAPAYPSAKDVELAFYTDVVYLIISFVNREKPAIAGFRIIEGKIKEEELRFNS